MYATVMGVISWVVFVAIVLGLVLRRRLRFTEDGAVVQPGVSSATYNQEGSP